MTPDLWSPPATAREGTHDALKIPRAATETRGWPLSHVSLCATPWTGFSRQEHWSGLPLPSPGALPDSGIEPGCLASPALASGFFATVPPGKTVELSGRRVSVDLTSLGAAK